MFNKLKKLVNFKKKICKKKMSLKKNKINHWNLKINKLKNFKQLI